MTPGAYLKGTTMPDVINPGPIVTVNPDTRVNTPTLLDKRLWVAVFTPILIILSKKFGIVLDATEIVTMVLPIVTFIAMSSWKSKSLAQTAIEAGAAAAATPTAPGVVPPAQQ